MFNFSIPHWHAWAPGIDSAESWQEWADNPYVPLAGGTPPSLNFLPPLQRRRLSPLARMAVACAWPLAENQPPMPVVYASHHGETRRGFELLQTLARDEPLSPTSFSLSVHNAIVGMWSILRKETTESVALSVQGDGLESAIGEACLLLNAGHAGVIVILAEERPPVEYASWIDDVPFSYAVALRLGLGDEFQLTPAPAASGPSGRQDQAWDAWPHPLSLLRHLALRSQAWTHTHKQRDWHWQHKS
jgi:hypothetical protein